MESLSRGHTNGNGHSQKKEKEACMKSSNPLSRHCGNSPNVVGVWTEDAIVEQCKRKEDSQDAKRLAGHGPEDFMFDDDFAPEEDRALLQKSREFGVKHQLRCNLNNSSRLAPLLWPLKAGGLAAWAWHMYLAFGCVA